MCMVGCRTLQLGAFPRLFSKVRVVCVPESTKSQTFFETFANFRDSNKRTPKCRLIAFSNCKYTSTIYIAPLTSRRSVCTLAFALSTSDRRYNQLGYSIYRQHQRLLLQIFDCCGQSADGLRLLQQIVFFQQMFQGK